MARRYTSKQTKLTRKADVVMLGTYPPRECGIATFTQDLVLSLRQWPELVSGVGVCAVNDWPASYRYGPDVRFTLEDGRLPSYRRTAQHLNHSGSDLICIQHEYGIFGGQDGKYVLDLMKWLQLPVVTTLHTVLSKPKGHFRAVTQEIIKRSDAIVVLAENARQLLISTCNADPEKIHYVPHGIPDVEWSPALIEARKRELGLEGRTVVATFGLLSPGKGIEYALEALPEVVSEHPDVLYLILGRTHPTIMRQQGEQYRQQLIDRCHALSIEDNVRFVNRYLSLKDLIRYLQGTDIYLMPYLNPEQIVSGTLAYAVGAGKPTIATAFAYATEVLADGRGIVVPFRDSQAISHALFELLEDEDSRLEMAARAYQHTRSWVWRSVGLCYAQLFHEILRQREIEPISATQATA